MKKDWLCVKQEMMIDEISVMITTLLCAVTVLPILLHRDENDSNDNRLQFQISILTSPCSMAFI